MKNIEEDARRTFSRREFIKGALKITGAAALGESVTGCGPGTETQKPKEPTDNAQETPASVNTPTLEPTEAISTPTVEPTKQPEFEGEIISHAVLTKEDALSPFQNIGGEETEEFSYLNIEHYASVVWGRSQEKLNILTASENPIDSLRMMTAVGPQKGVEGFFNPEDDFANMEGKNWNFLRFSLDTLPGDKIEDTINAEPQGLVIRKGTHITVLGEYADSTGAGRLTAVVVEEGLRRDENGIVNEGRETPRQYFAAIPTTLPKDSEGISLEKLINSSENWKFVQGSITDKNESTRWEINEISPDLAQEYSSATGVYWADETINPVIPAVPQELRADGSINYEVADDKSVTMLVNGETKAKAVYNSEAGEWEWSGIVVLVEPEQESKEVLYEEDFAHLTMNGSSEWSFGLIFNEVNNENTTGYFLSTVVLGEPEKRPINALDPDGNILYSYTGWFVKLGYPDNEGKLISGEALAYVEDMFDPYYIFEARNGIVQKSQVGSGEFTEDKEKILSVYKYGRPIITELHIDAPKGVFEQGIKRFNVTEPFPGVDPMARKVYFIGLMFDEENGIGRLDLPQMPTFDQVLAWKEGKEPINGFLGEMGGCLAVDELR